MKLSNDFVIKTSIESKGKYIESHIMELISKVMEDNVKKNNALDRFEAVYKSFSYNRDVIDVYNTGIAILRVADNPKFHFIYEIDDQYIANYELLRFTGINYEVVLTVFNKLIFLCYGRPSWYVDDEVVVLEILKKKYYESNVQQYLSTLTSEETIIYFLDVVPDCLFMLDHDRCVANTNITVKILN